MAKFSLYEIDEPGLQFGGPGSFVDPKVGLVQSGPFDLRFGSSRLSQINVGVIGAVESVDLCGAWIERMNSFIPSDSKNKLLYPDYLGFERTFHSKFQIAQAHVRTIADETINKLLKIKEPIKRFTAVLSVFEEHIKSIEESETIKPALILCCISPAIIDLCASVQNDKISKKQIDDLKKGFQLNLFDNPTLDSPALKTIESPEDLLTRDFRRALKAVALKANIPIQILTHNALLDSVNNQPACVRAWNLGVSMYYKAGGIPWRMNFQGPETCYIGVSFNHTYTNKDNHYVKSCIAQAFSSDGEGFALKGLVLSDEQLERRELNLNEFQVFSLGEKLLTEYRRRTGGFPLRIVLHKSTRFNEEEIYAFTQVFKQIPVVELYTIGFTDFRVLSWNNYPVKRGAFCTLDEDRNFLFTTGYISSIETYPGGHIPSPIEISSYGQLNSLSHAKEILSLTKMNWNTSSISGGVPVTLFFSRNIGGIMAEYSMRYKDDDPISSYRFFI